MKKIFSLFVAALFSVAMFAIDSWTVAGNNTTILGSSWSADESAGNDMVAVAGTSYFKLEKSFTELANKTWFEFKVVGDHGANGWGTAYPSSNYGINVHAGANYALFTFDTQTTNVGCYSACTVVGSSTTLFGTSWDVTNTDNDMTFANNVFTFAKADVTLPAGDITFKVNVNHDSDYKYAYPASDYTLNIPSSGKYNVTITFNPFTFAVSAEAELQQEEVVVPTVNMHANFTGSWADTEDFVKAANDETASLTLNLAYGSYEFGVNVDGSWTANGAAFTRANPAHEVVSGEGNLTLDVDQAGSYTFTWTYATNTLSVTYPTLVPAKFYVTGDTALVVAAGADRMQAWKAHAVKVEDDSFTIHDLAAGNYTLKVVTAEDAWLGYSDLTPAYKQPELYFTDAADQNICFTLSRESDVTITYIKDEVLKIECEDLALPTVQLIGIAGWTYPTDAITLEPAQDKLTASKTVTLTGDEDWVKEFKVVLAGAWLAKQNGGEAFGLHRDFPSVSNLTYAGDNLKLTQDGRGDVTFTWTYATGDLTLSFPPVSYYIAGSFTDWGTSKVALIEEAGIWSKTITISSTDEQEFQVVRDAGIDEAWFGLGAKTTMTPSSCTDWEVNTGYENIGLQITKIGDYGFEFNPDGNLLSVTYPTATAIDEVEGAVKAVKRVVNGQLVIEREGKFYNALGAEVK